MPHRQTLVLLARSSNQLECYVETGPGCSAGCVGCGQSPYQSPAQHMGRIPERSEIQSSSDHSGADTVLLPADLLSSSSPAVGPGSAFELELRGEMLIALSSLVYLLPVLLMLLFCVCCSVLFPGRESWVLGSAVAGLSLGMAAVCFCGEMIRQKLVYHLNVHSKA